MKNPFSTLYGIIPSSLVFRNDSFEQIITDFTNEDINAATYIITGIRGSGKTVLLHSIARELQSYSNWVIISLNPQGDFVSSMAEKLYDEVKKNRLGLDWSIDFSLPYVTFHIKKNQMSLSSESAIPHLLDILKKKNKRILISIDEVNSNNKLKYFANMYQHLISEDYPLFLLMTGLFENIDSLISSKAASFLARSPKIVLDPLNLMSISQMYQKELNATVDEANKLAILSKGYAFAYQIIGKICFERKKNIVDDDLLLSLDNYLFSNGYNVIWKGMTDVERKICIAMAKLDNNSTKNIIENTHMKVANFNNYRAKMIYKGYLEAKGYGEIEFSLPRFKEFVLKIEPLM